VTLQGFRAKVNEISPSILFTDCMIHREALASKKLEPFVNEVLQDAIRVINFIKSKALNFRLFTILCNKMGSDHTKLLPHTEGRCLSRGKILLRIVELKDEIRIFFLEHKNTLAEHFFNEEWLAISCYLVDIFDKLNSLNLSLQGKTQIFSPIKSMFSKKIRL